jgi:hypothetical protein
VQFYPKRFSTLPFAQTVTKAVRCDHEKDFESSVTVPVNSEAGFFSLEAIRLQFREGCFSIINLKKTSILGRVASIFS